MYGDQRRCGGGRERTVSGSEPIPKQALGSGMHHELQTLADPDAVARADAAFVAERARAAVAASGRFHFAVSGGPTPPATFAAPAPEAGPRGPPRLYPADRRRAPPHDPVPHPSPPPPA